MRAFAVANEMGRGGVSVAVVAAFTNSSVARCLVSPCDLDPGEGYWALPVV